MVNENDRRVVLEGRLATVESNIASIKGSLERIEVGLSRLIDKQAIQEVSITKNTHSFNLLKWIMGSSAVGSGILAAVFRLIS